MSAIALRQRELAIVVAFTALVMACTEQAAPIGEPSQATPSSSEQGLQEQLRRYAMRDLRESKFSQAKGELCDKILDENLEPTFGEMTVRIEGTKMERKLPAVLARHRFICQNNYLATKEPVEQWVILGLDAEFDVLRCVRTGPPHYIVQLFQDCSFRPSDQSFAFPQPEQVDKLWRADYAKALTKLPNSAAAQARQPVGLPSPSSNAWEDLKPLFVDFTCFKSEEGMLAAPWGNRRLPTKEVQQEAPDGKSMTQAAIFSDGTQESVTYFRTLADCQAATQGASASSTRK